MNWTGLTELRPEHVREALEAAGATPVEAGGFARGVMRKIEELRAAVQLFA